MNWLILFGGLLLLSPILYYIFIYKNVETKPSPGVGKNIITFPYNSNINYRSINDNGNSYTLGIFNKTLYLNSLNFSFDIENSIFNNNSKIKINIKDIFQNIIYSTTITNFNKVPINFKLNDLKIFKDYNVAMVLYGDNLNIIKPIISFNYIPESTTTYIPQPTTTYISQPTTTTYIPQPTTTTYIPQPTTTTYIPQPTTTTYIPQPKLVDVSYLLYTYEGNPTINNINNITLNKSDDVVITNVSVNNYDNSIYVEFIIPIIVNDDILFGGIFATDLGINSMLSFLKNTVGDIFGNTYDIDTTVENRIRIYSEYTKYIFYINDNKYEIKSQLLTENKTDLNFYMIFQAYKISKSYNINNIHFCTYKNS